MLESAVLGYLAAVLMGTTLGLIGGGGSILTVPILVYLFGVHPVFATAYSLFVVGLTGLIGSVGYMRRGQVDFRAVSIFGIPSLAGVFLTRRFLIPAVPDVIWSTGSVTVDKGLLIMLVFAVVMLLAAWSMIRGGREVSAPLEGGTLYRGPIAALEGLAVGCVTGFVGAGGGFLIVPALVVLLRLPMKRAIGTSLLVIAIKSLVGFTGDLYASSDMDWFFLAGFSFLSILGIVVGVSLNHRIPAARLKPIFGWFILVMGSFILVKEVLL